LTAIEKLQGGLALAAATVVLGGIVLACEKRGANSSDQPVISRILIDLPPEIDSDQQLRRDLRQVVQRRLSRGDTGLVWHPGDDGNAAIRVEVGDVGGGGAHIVGEHPIDDAETLSAYRNVRVSLRWQTPDGSKAFVVQGRGDQPEELLASIESGMDDALGVIARQLKLDVADDEGLIDAIGDLDIRVVRYAFDVIGARRMTAAVAPLCALLGDRSKTDRLEGNLEERVIGVLVEIGDQKAVDPLIEVTKRRDSRFVLTVAFALAAIGGRQAEAFLLTVASGHPDPVVRQGAGRALEEVRGR